MAVSEALVESTGQNLVGSVILGRYRVIRPIARGGMGTIYLGRVEGAAGFAKPVVVKTVHAALNDKVGAQLFAREARIVSNLQHPGIVAVIDFGKVGSAYVMVLEYVHGFHLGQWFRYVLETRGAMPVSHAVHVVLQVLDAFSYAHSLKRPNGASLGIVHRDVSPANILIDSQGHVKLHDFGIARMADDEYKSQDGTFRGTLPYTPPEGFGCGTPAPSYDQYACAVVLYQLLAGANPFKGKEPRETIALVLTHVPEPLSIFRDDVPPEIESAIARALSKDPVERFASTADFAAALRAGLEWSEEGAARETAAQIIADFEGADMAKRLGLESLASRNAAWREAQGLPTHHPVSLSSSPPTTVTGVTGAVTVSAPPQERAPKPAANASAIAHPRQQPRAASLLRAGALGAVAAALAAAAGAIYVSWRNPTADAPKYLLIEKQDTDKQSAPPVAAAMPGPAPAQVVPSASAQPSPPVTAPSASAAAKPARSASRGSELARAFQRQESKIQACFHQHADNVEGSPRLSVRFQIDASGTVRQAALSPAAIGASSLGECILGIARGTSFGPQVEPISFSIPIAARVVRR